MAKAQENTSENTRKSPEQLQKEVNSLKELLQEAYLEIQKLKESLQKYENPDDRYNKRWTMVTKLVFLVAKAGKPLRSAEIIPLLIDREPDIIKKQDSLEKYISAFLNTAMKHGRLVPYKLKGVRGNFYCLPEWISENGELLPEMRMRIY
ncbi:MAG: hypothetical protein JST86_09400 [Bacteroidetes bacterium]|nr:hypothetical protein [Bacteroidota bacterium]